eukprot:TRINITY_DN6284_c0_g1_i1.p5 TRINITY_DN6284_c0_g1~~TRINITY_DN6284_c0_g1_i1.p5  ORF type:complete len:101 (-),score=5.96 TRINITY_DN6284_c0_g1_i1:349-651(-)
MVVAHGGACRLEREMGCDHRFQKGRTQAPQPWVGSRLYVIGGTDGYNGPVDCVDVLDIASGGSTSWSSLAPLPTPRCEHSCAVVGCLLYVVGGDHCTCHT